MKRFKQSKNYPAGFSPEQIIHCQALLAAMPCPVRLQWNDQEVFACFDGWWLTSEFSPVLHDAHDTCRLSHHAARLRIHGQFGQSLPADWLFAMNYAEHKTLALLKLIRVLHLLNHLGRNGTEAALRIDLDPRICNAHSERIVDFTVALLLQLGMTPEQVRFLLFIDHRSSAAGKTLVARYREHHHRVGLGGFGEGEDDLQRLWQWEPDDVVLSPRYTRRAIMYPQVRDQLVTLMPQLVEQGFALGVEDIMCGNLLGIARQMQARYLAGSFVSTLMSAV
ncbi:EAL domain-containing protein [Pseudogulbenkiania subflava]|uniref:EAL domain, c-di-GMP-specific phosphodiesterase class I (Or its enzymatically inactive variant) n=1 Tax=Pseudogulbenkiania subflava DSM 22618 TaxID=1123014 RepID=A0A1Y6CGI6_9NEIS|nr:EAL domain-containing protein [Pseudogulbenkiania subflava]SMF53929.1 EAL domain, c-di-GMP-specific phosphodiesterase class I (or its enzymatically inactive variant) [Pseudogulbenkiania subflava DSM 22618]